MKASFLFSSLFLSFMPLNRNLKVDEASTGPSFVNKQTNHQAGACLLCVSSVQIPNCKVGDKQRYFTNLFHQSKERAGSTCKFCPRGREQESILLNSFVHQRKAFWTEG